MCHEWVHLWFICLWPSVSNLLYTPGAVCSGLTVQDFLNPFYSISCVEWMVFSLRAGCRNSLVLRQMVGFDMQYKSIYIVHTMGKVMLSFLEHDVPISLRLTWWRDERFPRFFQKLCYLPHWQCNILWAELCLYLHVLIEIYWNTENKTTSQIFAVMHQYMLKQIEF